MVELLIMSHRSLFFIKFKLRGVHTEGETQVGEQIVKLIERLFAEVTELEEVISMVCNQFAKCLNVSSLEAVESAY